ncbi:phage tail protein [Sphingomonas sp. 35-24ZXX]|uniref:phage tail protein n=1 Tax=Sphingomonas sp. 35-24ZXX TaxID=1545915 RepID=UPI00053C04AE|nr:phage tail protein [Sphingomonas sp. 35-24ZXX]
MATLVLSTVGTLVGGPLGGALGALIGRTIDQTVLFRPKDREGPRLTDLAVQSSQYGSAVARVHGRVRIAGTVIWATDLKERRIREGGGKGRPGTTRYSYSVSFAVALSSRPIAGVGRIWAEGNLLRGQDGVFTSETGFRLHHGHGDQPCDPLIAAAEGMDMCPAYRGLAYAVFEDMALEEFGNRIPSLTFEVLADEGEVALGPLVAEIAGSESPPAGGLGVTGWSLAAASRREALEAISTGFPLALRDAGGDVQPAWRELPDDAAVLIPRSALLPASAEASGLFHHQRLAPVPEALALRYYEPERDYQAGLRRSGTSASGHARQVDVPAVMEAGMAQNRVERLAGLARDGLERIELRLAMIDPAMLPGRAVEIEGVAGSWRVRRWHWSAEGTDVELVSQRRGLAVVPVSSDPGRSINAPDDPIGTTRLALFDLPSPLDRPMAHSHIALGVAGASGGWRGAHVYAVEADGSLGEALDFLRIGATMGMVLSPLGTGTPLLRDDLNTLTVQLVRDAPFALVNADDDALSRGANMAMVGAELIQFARVQALGDWQFRLSGLWRGRAGTEDEIAGHASGEVFVMVNEALGLVDPDRIGAGPGFRAAAQGRGDDAPVLADLPRHGRAVRPLSPVHGRVEQGASGEVTIRWTRRSRAGFAWRDELDVPIGEDIEAYRVTVLVDGVVRADHDVAELALTLDTVTMATLREGAPTVIEAAVSQRGGLGLSPPLRLFLPL